MPEVVRLSNCKVCVYADDHLPPHFHIRGRGWDVSVNLETLTLMAGRGVSNDIDEAIEWAESNVELLYQVWKRLNERD
jgi:Domain of unknown function (DUF4160)